MNAHSLMRKAMGLLLLVGGVACGAIRRPEPNSSSTDFINVPCQPSDPVRTGPVATNSAYTFLVRAEYFNATDEKVRIHVPVGMLLSPTNSERQVLLLLEPINEEVGPRSARSFQRLATCVDARHSPPSNACEPYRILQVAPACQRRILRAYEEAGGGPVDFSPVRADCIAALLNP